MSRMYDLLTGTTPRSDAASRNAAEKATKPTFASMTNELSEESFPFENSENPFIEVGGPSGPTYSPSLSLVKLMPREIKQEEPLPEQKTPERNTDTSDRLSGTEKLQPAEEKLAGEASLSASPREFPRLAEPTPYLAITFHDLMVQKDSNPSSQGLDPTLVALHYPDHRISGEYRRLRDAIRTQLPEQTPRVLMFTATASQAGTTTVLSNLAITIARSETSRVLVVDANIPHPAVDRKFSLKVTLGLVEVLEQKVPLAWSVQPSGVPNLEILPAGWPIGVDATSIGLELAKLIDQLRQWYDWVLIDAGVWSTMPEIDRAISSADAVYLVSREADYERPEFQALKVHVREAGGLPKGFIVTRG